jgi:hypothetical protein
MTNSSFHGRAPFVTVDAVEENLKKTIFDRVCKSAKKEMFMKIGHFAPVVLMIQRFLCSGIYGSRPLFAAQQAWGYSFRFRA